MSEGIPFYRCKLCASVVSQWDIYDYGECAKCGHHVIVQTNLRWWEKIVQVFKHPLIWKWHELVQPK